MRIKDTQLYDKIPNTIKDINNLFKQEGKKLYLVGGSVRDHRLGITPKDFDLATDALPDEILRIIGDKWESNLQGKAFGVIVVYADDCPGGIEIATFRSDLTKGRNPDVELGVTIEKDVERRDLTFNSLFYDLDTKEIVDLTGGLEDLKNNVTRTVGSAIDRFKEDALRVLRAIRFATRFGHSLDKDITRAIKEMNSELVCDGQRISQERIWEEFTKSFTQCKGDKFTRYIHIMRENNLLKEVFPGLILSDKTPVISTDLSIIIAQIVDESNGTSMVKTLVQDCKVPQRNAVQVEFLHSIKTLTGHISPEHFDTLLKKRVKSQVDRKTLLEWFNINGLTVSEHHMRFLDFKPETDSETLMKQGFSGPELGKQIRIMNFKQFQDKTR